LEQTGEGRHCSATDGQKIQPLLFWVKVLQLFVLPGCYSMDRFLR
jgi:hypothetical protein